LRLPRIFRGWVIPLAVTPTLICGSSSAATPSFDCTTAKAPVEKVICESEPLATADAQLAQAFNAYLAAHPDGRRQAIEDQRQWLRSRLVSCKTPDMRAIGPGCLLTLYKARTEELRDPDKAGISRAGEDRAICDGLAERMRQVKPSSKPALLIGGLSDAGDPFVKLGLSPSEQAELSKRVRPRLPPNPDLDFTWDENGDARDFAGSAYEWDRLGNSSIIAASVIEGTAHCQHLTFFDIAGDGPAKSVPPPEFESDGAPYCAVGGSGGRGELGEIGGRPTFVGVDFGDGAEDYRLIVRSRDRWLRSCRIHATWQPEFALSDSYCVGPFCEAVQKQAVSIVRTYDATGDLSAFWSKVKILPTPEAHKRRLEAVQGKYWTINLGGTPTTIAEDGGGHRFLAVSGASPDSLTVTDITPNDRDEGEGAFTALNAGDSGNPYDTFDDDSTIAPLSVDGKTYLLRVGHAHFTYRTSNDYLLCVFGSNNGKIEPLAGFFIGKKHGPEATVTVLDPSVP